MAAANPTTYSQLYQQAPDAFGGQYAVFMDPFGAESGVAPATLRDTVLASTQVVPKVFVYLTELPTVMVRVVSRVTRVAPTMGMVTQWDNEAFAFTSDVGPGNQVSVVCFPTGAVGTNTEAPFGC